MFGTHYELKLDPSMLPFDHEWSASPEKDGGKQYSRCDTLVDVQYKTRLKGFMRPRRCSSLLHSLAVYLQCTEQLGRVASRLSCSFDYITSRHIGSHATADGLPLARGPWAVYQVIRGWVCWGDRMKVSLPPISTLDRFRSAAGLAADRAAARAAGEESSVHSRPASPHARQEAGNSPGTRDRASPPHTPDTAGMPLRALPVA
jgi:hypothetical protein